MPLPPRLAVLTMTALALLLTAGAVGAETIHLLTHPFDPADGKPTIESRLTWTEPSADERVYYLVQLTGPPTDVRKDAIESAGGELIAYIPDHTYLVRLDAAARDAVASSSAVGWVGPYHPAYKLDPSIGKLEFRNPDRAADPLLTVTVCVFDDLSGTARAIGKLGAEVLTRSDVGGRLRLVARVPPESLEAIARLREVWWIEEKPEFYLANDSTCWVVQTNVEHAMPVWQMGLHGEGQIVAVMDSGLDYNSCWFRDVGSAPPGPAHRKVIDYELWGGNAYDGCENGHGTHVCGTLAGDQSYVNPGVYDYNGVAYAAKIALQDVGADDNWACNTGAVEIPDTLYHAYADAYDVGARIHTNSWGGANNTYNEYCADVDAFMWDHPDFLLVFAAGNWGPGSASITYPGTAKNCLTVGATRRAPGQEVLAGYSSRGPAFDGRYKPTVTAPGGEAAFAYINSAGNDTGDPPSETCDMVDAPFEGTSMATPAVAGLAAIVRQYFTEGWYPSGTQDPADAIAPSAALLKAAIMNSAADMIGDDSPPGIPNNHEGWGRPIVEDVLYFYGDARELIVNDETPGVGQSETVEFEFEVDSATVPLEFALVWTDHGAPPACGLAIQNNLDLTVTRPDGIEFKGNRFLYGESVPGGIYDTRNVEEAVMFKRPQVGTHTVRVHGLTVPHSPQPFALVSTGSFADWPGGTGVDEGGFGAGGRAFELESVAPNPFNPSTTIAYRLFPVATGKARTVLRVYSLDGRLVATLVDRVQDPGSYAVAWNGRGSDGAPVASGVYFVELRYGGETGTRKLTLLK